MDCLKYLELYKTSWSQLAADMPCLCDDENRSIQTTWRISYEYVLRSNPTAGKLLQLWAYLDHQDIWYKLFFLGRHGWKECDWFQELASSEINFKRVMKTLLAFSLIESHQHIESYSTHPVVHDWSVKMISDGKSELMVAALTIVGTTAFHHSSNGEYWLSKQRLRPHADRCIRQIDDPNVLKRLRPVETNQALNSLGVLYADLGMHAEAEKMYQWALDGFEKASGADDIPKLNIVNNLGVLYADQGKHVEAERMYRLALDGYENVLGAHRGLTLHTVNNLGIVYAAQRKYMEAEKMYQRALDGFEKVWGVNYHTTLSTVNGMGILYAKQGKYMEAEKMFQRALNGYEKILGPDHPSTLDTVKNLRQLKVRQFEHKKVEEKHSEVPITLQSQEYELNKERRLKCDF